MIEKLQELWNSNVQFSWWMRIGLGLLFLILAFLFYGGNWYLQKEAMIEFGYPKTSKKAIRKRFLQYSLAEKVTLSKLRQQAKRKGFMLSLCWMLNIANLLFAACSVIGFVGLLITGGSGWSLVLLVILPLEFLLISVAIRFIPDLLWLPSERRRYF